MIKNGFLRFCDDPEIVCCKAEAELGQLRQENIRLRAELTEETSRRYQAECNYDHWKKQALESQRRERAAVEDMKQFGQCGACAKFYRVDGCGANAHSYCDGGFKWRGPQDEEGAEK